MKRSRSAVVGVLGILILLNFLRSGHCVGLEATLIAVDNSAYMINEDQKPDRMTCQQECVNLICNVKTQNPDNTIGIMAMASPRGACPRVYISAAMNQDVPPILMKLNEIHERVGHTVQFEKSLRVGWLSFRNRLNKNLRPRIVAIVASPIEDQDPQPLVHLGRRLRKNNVAVDVISFGSSTTVNAPVLQAFVAAVTRDGNSHLLTVPPDNYQLGGITDALFSSP
eukprot:CAMPEP_0113709424 /NCGR_PEP_ID=MMETSP0038_2-20120614/29562_1 /TAXON_ID=2898 /ORGANISM="Cryptomonas paramecium" /LENGTH=224 /DNA_ID=CAMNT_0000635305 /DNA_START=16 /DNA_END=687 /DNA_ORIENTATION=+ /assembly_acc=CAM_ASM_000170